MIPRYRTRLLVSTTHRNALGACARVVGSKCTSPSIGDLKGIHQPTLVVNGIHDEMIPVSNSYRLAENLPNAVLLVYPDSGHGSLFQFHESFTRQAAAFLASEPPFAPY